MAFADFQALYKQKLTTADEAVKVIKSGDWVDYGFCAIHPRVLDEALARRAPELEDVKVRGGSACGSRRSSTSRIRCTISSSTLTT